MTTGPGNAGGFGSPPQPALPQEPVWLSLNGLKDTARLVPFVHAGPLSTLMVQQNCQFTAPTQKSPKLLPGFPSLFRSKKNPGPVGPMFVPAVPCTELYQPQVPPLPPQVAGGVPGVRVARSQPGPKLAVIPWNQFAFVEFQKVTVKQKVTVSPQA
jgi:hypothetical protein